MAFSAYSINNYQPHPSQEIRTILQKRKAHLQEKVGSLRSFDGQTVLQTMQFEFNKDQANCKLYKSIVELKSQNMKIGKEFEETIKMFSGSNQSKTQIEPMFDNVVHHLISEGIAGDLATQVVNDAMEFLVAVPPEKLPSILERSIKAIESMICRLEDGELITKYLYEEQEMGQKIKPLMFQYWDQLSNYQEIMGVEPEPKAKITDVSNSILKNRENYRIYKLT